MAEAPPTTSEETLPMAASGDRPDKEKVIKEVFSSALWHYTVHKYIGDIVQDNHFNIDYEQEHKDICYQWYCDTVSMFMEYIMCTNKIAIAVLRALRRSNPAHHRYNASSNPEALIAEDDAIYIFATYSFECFEYLLSSFAVGLRKNCFSFVEKQLRELAEKEPSEELSEQIEEFISKHDDSLDNDKVKAMEQIGKLDAHQYYQYAIELMTPLFITSKEIDPTTMPAVPNDPNLFEEYFLRVCSIRLSLVLAKEKEKFDADFSEPRERLRPKMISQFKRLTSILANPGVPPRERPYTFTAVTREFRRVISKWIIK